MIKLVQLKDNNGNDIYPITPSACVQDETPVDLSTDINSCLSDFKSTVAGESWGTRRYWVSFINNNLYSLNMQNIIVNNHLLYPVSIRKDEDSGIVSLVYVYSTVSINGDIWDVRIIMNVNVAPSVPQGVSIIISGHYTPAQE